VALMDREEVLARLQRIEQEHPVFALREDGVAIWPLVRIALGMRALAGPAHATQRQEGGDSTNGLRLVRGLGQMARLYTHPPKADLLFLTTRTYQALEDGRTVDKFAHPLMEAAEELGRHCVLLGIDEPPMHPWRRLPNACIMSVHEARRLVSAWHWRRQPPPVHPSFHDSPVHHALTKAFPQPLVNGLTVALHDLRILREFHGMVLDRMRPRHVFVTCWYSVDNMALIHECHERGIPTTDLQHGVQGPTHLAYGRWHGMDAAGCSVLPDSFWCWDTASTDHLESWLPPAGHRAFNGGAPWLERHLRERPVSGPPNVLFSAQPIREPLPQGFAEVIRRGPELQWTFRLHPNALQLAASIRTWAEQNSIAERVLIQLPDEVPIAQALAQAAVHVTSYSSVIREAALAGVPSIALDRGASALYPDLVATGQLRCIADMEGVNTLIRELSASRPAAHDPVQPPLGERLKSLLA
jgi:hypothetical protein